MYVTWNSSSIPYVPPRHTYNCTGNSPSPATTDDSSNYHKPKMIFFTELAHTHTYSHTYTQEALPPRHQTVIQKIVNGFLLLKFAHIFAMHAYTHIHTRHTVGIVVGSLLGGLVLVALLVCCVCLSFWYTRMLRQRKKLFRSTQV